MTDSLCLIWVFGLFVVVAIDAATSRRRDLITDFSCLLAAATWPLIIFRALRSKSMDHHDV